VYNLVHFSYGYLDGMSWTFTNNVFEGAGDFLATMRQPAVAFPEQLVPVPIIVVSCMEAPTGRSRTTCSTAQP